MIIQTESGSRYEIDAVNRRARRFAGSSAPTEMCADGWRPIDYWGITIGRLWIAWDEPGKVVGQRGTLTSLIVSIDGRPYR